MTIPKKLLQHRIRNRLIEYFDLSSEEIAQWGACEIVNQWQDIVPHGWDPGFFDQPVFSAAEQSHIQNFCVIWNAAADATPDDDIFSVAVLNTSPQWRKFLHDARAAFECFSKRGKFSEEVVEF